MSSKEQTQPVDQEDDRLQKEMNLYHNVAKAIFSRLGKEDQDNASEAYAFCEKIIKVAEELANGMDENMVDATKVNLIKEQDFQNELDLYLLVRQKIQQKQAKTQNESEVVDKSTGLISKR